MKKSLFFLPLLSLSLFSCGQSNYELADYVKEVDLFSSKDTAKILVMTDLHWSYGSDVKLQSEYVSSLVSKAEPDFIFILGDSFYGANSRLVNTLLDLIDSFKRPWAFVYGNHDEAGLYSPHYISQQALLRTYCVNSECFDDSITGDSNFVVNLTDGTTTKFQLYGLDSNSLHYENLDYNYGTVEDDQVDWYSHQVELAQSNNGGTVVPSYAFFHIPIWEYAFAEQASISDPDKFYHGGDLHESVYSSAPKEVGETKCCVGYKQSQLFKQASKLGSTKAMFCGHDHKNDFHSNYQYDGSSEGQIYLSYALKTGDGCYFEKGMMGGISLNVHSDGSFDPASDANFIFQSYEELGE